MGIVSSINLLGRYMQHLKYFAYQLLRLRRDAGLTQSQLAHRLGVNQSYIAKLESAKEEKQPTIDFLLSVGELFNVGIDDLLGTHRNGQVPVNDVDMLPEDIREPIQLLISRLSRESREKRWQSQSDLTMAIGGPAGVAAAGRSIGTVVTPNNNGLIPEKV
jgi:transcriptional regulator with XRE-family HTH domain